MEPTVLQLSATSQLKGRREDTAMLMFQIRSISVQCIPIKHLIWVYLPDTGNIYVKVNKKYTVGRKISWRIKCYTSRTCGCVGLSSSRFTSLTQSLFHQNMNFYYESLYVALIFLLWPEGIYCNNIRNLHLFLHSVIPSWCPGLNTIKWVKKWWALCLGLLTSPT